MFRQHDETITSSGKLNIDRKNILIKHGIENYNRITHFVSYYYYWIKYKIKNIR